VDDTYPLTHVRVLPPRDTERDGRHTPRDDAPRSGGRAADDDRRTGT
jgi:hypothetical protein